MRLRLSGPRFGATRHRSARALSEPKLVMNSAVLVSLWPMRRRSATKTPAAASHARRVKHLLRAEGSGFPAIVSEE